MVISAFHIFDGRIVAYREPQNSRSYLFFATVAQAILDYDGQLCLSPPRQIGKRIYHVIAWGTHCGRRLNKDHRLTHLGRITINAGKIDSNRNYFPWLAGSQELD